MTSNQEVDLFPPRKKQSPSVSINEEAVGMIWATHRQDIAVGFGYACHRWGTVTEEDEMLWDRVSQKLNLPWR